MAMKPLSEKTFVDQALKNKKGISWLDDGRIPYEEGGPTDVYGTSNATCTPTFNASLGQHDFRSTPHKSGRFPANLLVSDDVLNDGRVTKSSGGKSGHTGAYSGGFKEEYYQGAKPGLGDSGSFSRYFDLDRWWEEKIKELPASVQKTFPFLIVPKASKSEKNRGLDYVPQPIVGRDEGQDIRNVPQKAGTTPRINWHPTVKPLKLMSYLITLGSREGDVVLDPFVGSGTLALAANFLGRKAIVIDCVEEYCAMTRDRVKEEERLISKAKSR